MFQYLFYNFLKAYFNLGLHLFFKKIKIVGKENVPDQGAVMFVANHQNALIDALLVGTQNGRRTYFVARADVFKKPLYKKILAMIYMMPIYRIRDGIKSLSKNEAIFEKSKNVLNDGECFAIFPEGNHAFERKLRPLSKGFTRIALGVLDENPNLNLKIVPIGINYSNHRNYRSSVSLYFGKAIKVKDFHHGDFAKDSLALKEEVASRLRKLITHIDENENYEAKARALEATDPDYLNPFETNLKLESLDISQKIEIKKTNNWWKIFLRIPIWMNNILPLMVWFIIKRGINDPVMATTIKFCVGIFVFPFFYLAQAIVITLFFGEWVGIAYLVTSIITLPLAANDS
jgi:1-acyl-sn-glycerol-3-phosphate acyltransferase